MIRRLRDDVGDHYLSQDPPRTTVERLKSMEAATRRRRSERSHRWVFAALVAATTVVATGILTTVSLRTFLFDTAMGVSPVARELAEEIARHHHQRLGVEFTASSYGELRRRMDKLDFTLTEAKGATEGLRLLGARYGSIGGRLAAQLHLEDGDGEAVTLVQTALVDELEGLEWAELRTGGLRVDLWQEDGVFLALARTP